VSDFVYQRWIAPALLGGFQGCVDGGEDLGVPAGFGAEDVVLGEPVADGAPGPEGLSLGQMAFGWGEEVTGAKRGF
jgi:hypothetical protein